MTPDECKAVCEALRAYVKLARWFEDGMPATDAPDVDVGQTARRARLEAAEKALQGVQS